MLRIGGLHLVTAETDPVELFDDAACDTMPARPKIEQGFLQYFLEAPRGAGKVLFLPAAKRPECCGGPLPPTPG